MDVRACRSCRRLFNYLSGPSICPNCSDELEKKFYNVKEFIRENPQANLREISENMDVTTNQLQQWVREERLQFSEDSGIAMQCERCGAKIFTGRYCENCKTNVANGLTKAFAKDKKKEEPPKEKKPSGNKMRFMKG